MARHTVVRGGRVLDAKAHRADPADILIAGDTIREIGAPGLAAPQDAAVVDARDRLLMPGLVNAHTHGNGNLAKGKGDRWTLETLLNEGSHLHGGRALEDKYLTCLLGGLEMIRSGTTSCYDLFGEYPLPTLDGFEAAARGYAEAGVRAVLTPMVGDRSLYRAIPGLYESLPPALQKIADRFEASPTDEVLAAIRAIVHGWRESHGARLALAPTVPLYCSDRFILACRDMAREAGLPLHMHIGESKAEAVGAVLRYGKTMAAHMDAIGFLGPTLTAAHAVWLDEDDMTRFADRGVRVAHNPGSNMRLGCGIAPAARLRGKGVAVGIGTDGPHCSDGQNMFLAMRATSMASRIVTADPDEWLAAEDVVAMATEHSAGIVGLGGQVGRLAPGYKADMIFLDLGNLNFVPFNDPTNQVVLTENGASVDSVMVGGRLVLDHGRFPHVDVEAVRKKVEARVEALRAANEPTKALAQKLEQAVATYCVGLARKPYHVERQVPGGQP